MDAAAAETMIAGENDEVGQAISSMKSILSKWCEEPARLQRKGAAMLSFMPPPPAEVSLSFLPLMFSCSYVLVSCSYVL